MINDGIYGYVLAYRWKHEQHPFDQWQPIGMVFSRHDRDVLLNDWKARACHDGKCQEYAAFPIEGEDL